MEEIKPIRRLTPENRRVRYNPKKFSFKLSSIIERLKNDSQFLRQTVQLTFLAILLVIGIQFFMFVKWVESDGGMLQVSRPPGVESFLPIGALISLKYWFKTGIINTIHPSGLFIFVAILLISWGLKKSFCSWICPVGWISEVAWKLGKKIFRKNYTIPRWLDKGLRGIKYLLMGFFVWIIVFGMDTSSLENFIQGPYNRVADIKMLYFFIHITQFTAIVLAILFALSMVYKNFWCRYLCPYGALVGIFSKFSPVKITRNVNSCIDCELCTKVCPSFIKVHQLKRVSDMECTGCLTCVEVCPVKDTLDMKTSPGGRKILAPVFASLLVGIFFAVVGFAMLTGHWKNNISNEEYIYHIHRLEGPEYTHF